MKTRLTPLAIGLCAAAAATLGGTPATAQCTPTQSTLFGAAGTTGVAVDGNYLYYNRRGGVDGFDATNPASPVPVATSPHGVDASDLALSGTLMVATFAGPVNGTVYDISVPGMPMPVGTFPVNGTACAIDGTTAYISDGTTLHIFDLSTPATPATLGSLSTGTSTARDLEIVGSLIFVAQSADGLVIVDVSNPASPSIVGSFATPVTGVDVVGTTAYLGDQSGTLRILDCSTPATPVLLGSVTGPAGPGWGDVAVSGTRLYFAGNPDTWVVDISDSSTPVVLGSVGNIGGRRIVANGPYAYGGSLGGAEIFDFSSCLPPPADLTLEIADCPDDADPASGNQIAVELRMSNLGGDATGYQAFLNYDNATLTYRGDLSSYAAGPFPQHIQAILGAEVAAGELRLDGSVNFGDPGTSADALLATLVFDVDVECSNLSPVTFDLNQDFDSELSFDGDGLDTTLTDAPSVTLDDTDPVLDPCPANITQAADADNGDGCQGAIVTFVDPMATDNCTAMPVVVCSPASGSFFPVGTTTVTCTATDDCGNESSCTFDVTVTATNLIALDIELAGVNVATSRCMSLRLDDCTDLDVTLSFVDHDGDDTNENGIDDATEGGAETPSTSVRYVGNVEVPCGNWTLLCVKDEQHTLWDTSMLSVAGPIYTADSLVSLEAGDTDNDGDVDINDVTLLIAQFGTTAQSGGCAWDGTRDADFSNNGAVGAEDYSLLTGNWLTTSGCACSTLNDGGGFGSLEVLAIATRRRSRRTALIVASAVGPTSTSTA